MGTWSCLFKDSNSSMIKNIKNQVPRAKFRNAEAVVDKFEKSSCLYSGFKTGELKFNADMVKLTEILPIFTLKHFTLCFINT